jgi:DNA-binding transcriptional regulator LsrR (DeoR family)
MDGNFCQDDSSMQSEIATAMGVSRRTAFRYLATALSS